MTSPSVRVVKVGGSLFDLSHLPRALDQWLAGEPPGTHVLVAGGGAMADWMREADGRFHLDPAVCHWICVGLLSASARLTAALLPQAQLVTDYAELKANLRRGGHRAIVFAVEDFLRNEETLAPGPPLPRDWRVTSDSIAARLAWALSADELVLLKSTDLPPGMTRASAASAGFVDQYFPVAAEPLTTVRWVNLRAADYRETCLP